MLEVARLAACGLLSVCALSFLAAAEVRAQSEPVTVRASAEDGFGRLVFRFPERTDLPQYEVGAENGVLIIDFGIAIASRLPDIAQVLPETITVARLDPDQRGVRMGLSSTFDLSVKDAGEELYVDLLPPDWQGVEPGLPPEAIARLEQRADEAEAMAQARRRAELVEEFDPQVDVRVGRLPTQTRLVFDWSVGTEGTFTREGDTGRVTFDWPIAIALSEVRSGMPDALESVQNEVGDADTSVVLEVASGASMRFYQETPSRYVVDIGHGEAERIAEDGEEDSLDVADLLARIDTDPDFEGANLARAASPAQIAAELENSAQTVSTQTEVIPLASRVGTTARLTFPFPRETASAVFRRGDVVWLIFDTEMQITEPEQINLLEGAASDFSVIGAGGAQVVRLTLGEGRLASVSTEGSDWVLSLGDILLDAAEPIRLEQRQVQNDHPQIVANLARPGHVHTLRDPGVGDFLEVVTAYPPARAVVRSLDYADFSVPQSVHGMVVRPKNETVDVGIEDTLAVIRAPDGLNLSPPVDRRLVDPMAAQNVAMQLEGVRAPHLAQFITRREELAARTTDAQGSALDHARLELATYYVGNDLGPEALGVLELMQEQLKTPALEPDLAIARAAALVLSAHHEDAAQLLSSEALGTRAEAMFWRTIARSAIGEHAAARLDALSAMEVAESYPPWLQARFYLAGIESAIAQDDRDMAQRLLTSVDVANLNPEQLGRYELMSGQMDEANGRYREALEAYGRVLDSDIRPIVPEAVMRTISVLDTLGQLEPARAIDTLWTHATAWRGDERETAMLDMLVGLQFRAGQYRDAFTNVREASVTHPSSASLDSMVSMARTHFESLYLDGGADALPPIDALSIYYDFRHLTPSGSDGDIMIRNLAQRLIAVDLLDQAAELLAYQIENRLEGAARTRVAADLAVVRIANRQPDAALEALYDTRLAGVPPQLQRQRRILEARALIDAQREDLALDMLSSLQGRDTDLLRIEALWQAERHREAAELIEILYSPQIDSGALEPAARTNIVKAAVGYVLAQDRMGLTRLRSKFSGVMAQAPEWPMFAYVTDDVNTQAQGFRAIAREIAAVDSLEGFLGAYRDIYGQGDALVPNAMGGADVADAAGAETEPADADEADA